MGKIKKILAPTDFSELSKIGIRYALEAARDVSAEVLVYHVIDFGGDWTNVRAGNPPYRDMLENSRQVLDRFLASHFADCIGRLGPRRYGRCGRIALSETRYA